MRIAWLQKQNVHGMDLLEGNGNLRGQLLEGDKINTIYILVKLYCAIPFMLMPLLLSCQQNARIHMGFY